MRDNRKARTWNDGGKKKRGEIPRNPWLSIRFYPSIVDKEPAKIENERRKWTGTGSEQAGEGRRARDGEKVAFFGNPRAACVAALLLPEG